MRLNEETSLIGGAGAHIQQIAGCHWGGVRTIWDRLFCTLQPEWQRNRFYFGEANQFQLSWEP
jgi:hypothetical protein